MVINDPAFEALTWIKDLENDDGKIKPTVCIFNRFTSQYRSAPFVLAAPGRCSIM